MTTKRTAHSVYNLNYHIVFVTKYRHQVLTGSIETFIKERARDICLHYGWELLEIEVRIASPRSELLGGRCLI